MMTHPWNLDYHLRIRQQVCYSLSTRPYFMSSRCTSKGTSRRTRSHSESSRFHWPYLVVSFSALSLALLFCQSLPYSLALFSSCLLQALLPGSRAYLTSKTMTHQTSFHRKKMTRHRPPPPRSHIHLVVQNHPDSCSPTSTRGCQPGTHQLYWLAPLVYLEWSWCLRSRSLVPGLSPARYRDWSTAGGR